MRICVCVEGGGGGGGGGGGRREDSRRDFGGRAVFLGYAREFLSGAIYGRMEKGAAGELELMILLGLGGLLFSANSFVMARSIWY